MADNDQVVNEAELHDENVMEEAHDPKNAEVQSVDSVDAAAKAIKTQAPVPKTKAGMINAMYQKFNGMTREDLQHLFASVMSEEILSAEEGELAEESYQKKLRGS